jgi:hypothetical protein
VEVRPLTLPAAKAPPSAPFRIILLDPEGPRPKLGPNYATAATDIAAMVGALGHPPEAIAHKNVGLTLDDYRDVGDRDAFYFHGHGDGFAGFGVIASGVAVPAGGAQALLAAGDIVANAPLADQRVLLSMDEAELALTQHFFETAPKAPRLVFLNGFPIGRGRHFSSVFTQRGAAHFLAWRGAGWDSDVDYLGFRALEELLAGHDLRKVAETAHAIAGGELEYDGPGHLFEACGAECKRACAQGILLDCFGGKEEPTKELCDRLADNTSTPIERGGSNVSTTTEAAEAAKKHAADQARLASAPPRGTELPPEETVPLCTKQLMDAELATILATYANVYVAQLKGFRGCLDITQDLALMLLGIAPPVQCWRGGVAWRMSVIVNGLVCVSNFMHNAFLIAPKTRAYGHEPIVLDPYEFWGWSTHTAKRQSLLEFIGDATGGGAQYGSTSVTPTVEAARAQKTVDQMATEDDCDDVFACLKKEFPNITNSCQ